MILRSPKTDGKYAWTNHVQDKMRYYRLSESLIKRIVRFPRRTEAGVAPDTIAVMQRNDRLRTVRGKKAQVNEEIWVMYQEAKGAKPKSKLEAALIQPKIKIISAWRYPGISPTNKPVPVPEEILQELTNLLN